MRSEFQDVFKDAYDHWIDDACSQRYYASRNLALQVWRHQQAKVEELQYKAKLRESDHQALLVKYQATKKCWEDMSKEKDELQKRVDASLIAFEKLKEEINELHGQCDLHLIKYLEEKSQVLEQALKGGEA